MFLHSLLTPQTGPPRHSPIYNVISRGWSEWNHTAHNLVGLVSFTQHTSLEIHPGRVSRVPFSVAESNSVAWADPLRDLRAVAISAL